MFLEYTNTRKKRKREEKPRNSAPCLSLEVPIMTCGFYKTPPWTVPMKPCPTERNAMVLW
jgi:hypothetical protein